MALSHNPKIVTDGLALYLDAANSKSYNGAENLMDASEDIQVWGASNCTYLANVTTAPDGTKTATAVMATAADVSHYIIRAATGTTVSNTIYTFSIYVKKKGTLFSNLMFQPLFKDSTYSYIANWNLTAKTATTVGTGITSSIEELDDGWFRVTSTFNSATGANPIQPLIYIGNYGNILGDGTSGFYMWGAQLELGSYATKYTKTTTAAIVRSTTWNDLSKNSNTGTLANSVAYNNGQMIFDGSNDYIDITNSSIGNFGTTNFTVSCWGKATVGSIGNRGIFSKYNPHSGNGTGWFMFYRDGNVYCRITQDLVAPLEASTLDVNVTSNQWYNIVITRNATSFSLFLNGVLGQTKTTTNIIDCSSTAPLRIGSGYSAGYYFSGNAGASMIYNRALSAEEVKQNFNALRGRYGV